MNQVRYLLSGRVSRYVFLQHEDPLRALHVQHTASKFDASIFQKISQISLTKNDAHHDLMQQWRSFSGSESGRSNVYTSAVICNDALNPTIDPSNSIDTASASRHQYSANAPLLSSARRWELPSGYLSGM